MCVNFMHPLGFEIWIAQLEVMREEMGTLHCSVRVSHEHFDVILFRVDGLTDAGGRNLSPDGQLSPILFKKKRLLFTFVEIKGC